VITLRDDSDNMRFNIDEIGNALFDFQQQFPRINETLEMRREEFSAVMRSRILEAYSYLNSLLDTGSDLFTPAGLSGLLELNHIILCGNGPENRQDYYQHLAETRKSFQKRIKPIAAWVLANRNADKPYRLATGFYTQMLSRPQLFLEGNHRTGNIILNYLLVSKGKDPYIIEAKTAKTYLDLSGNIKFTNNSSSIETAFMMPAHAKRFRAFLKERGNGRFLTREE